MSEARQHRAPLTLGLVVQIRAALSSRGMTQEDFRLILNKHLPECRKIENTHSGMVQLGRWLNASGPNWPEPFGEIALAMQESLKEIS